MVEDDFRTQAPWRKGHLEELWAAEHEAPRPSWTKPRIEETSIPSPPKRPARRKPSPEPCERDR
jgi:hypothetical protein